MFRDRKTGVPSQTALGQLHDTWHGAHNKHYAVYTSWGDQKGAKLTQWFFNLYLTWLVFAFLDMWQEVKWKQSIIHDRIFAQVNTFIIMRSINVLKPCAVVVQHPILLIKSSGLSSFWKTEICRHMLLILLFMGWMWLDQPSAGITRPVLM